MNFEQPSQLYDGQTVENPINSRTIEQQANSPENATELLFFRLSNPIIKKQIIDLLYQAEIWAEKNVVYNEPIKEENGIWRRDTDGNMIFNKTPHVARSIEEIEADYNKTQERIMSFTEIGFTNEEPRGGNVDTNEKIFLGWKLPSGEKPNTQQWSIIEAHEKGHSMRPYGFATQPKFFREYFSKAFDLSAVEFTQEDYRLVLEMMERSGKKYEDTPTFEGQKEEFFRYLFSGEEIAERMSQLKNYFGFKGDEEFTLEHLRYAKEHYVADTGFDNRMSPFLKAITPKTEAEFIRLINCSGI